MTQKPNVNSAGEKELKNVEKQFEAFESEVKDLSMKRMDLTKKPEVEQQTQLSQQEIANSKDIYLKPIKRIGCKEKFNESFRQAYEFDKEYVHFIAENKELIGESIDMWTRPYPGMPAEEWMVPVNTPVWAPRYVAEQIKRKFYNRLVMKDQPTGSDGKAQYHGTLVIDTTIPRLDAFPATSGKRSMFMGKTNFLN